MGKLDGKVALVTGGSSGIGLASAQALAGEGAFVFIMGRRPDVLQEAVKTLGRSGAAIQGDVTNEADLDRAYAQIKRDWNHLDLLFANAAAQISGGVGQIEKSHYDLVFDTNVLGTIYTVQKALPLMRRGGSIVMTSSIASVKGNAGRSLYGASKAAVRALARGWANDLRQHGIRVNAISPGPTATGAFRSPGMSDEAFEQTKLRIGANVPIGRVAEPAEIAKAVLFLLSDEGSFVTGTDMFVDGGSAQF